MNQQNTPNWFKRTQVNQPTGLTGGVKKMGDRALIQFTDSTGEVSPVCYLHWNGTDAPEYIKECAKLMESRGEDLSYAFARFVGICHSHIGGNLSLGLWNQTTKLEANDSHGDAGCFVVHCGTWEVDAFGGDGESFSALGKTADH